MLFLSGHDDNSTDLMEESASSNMSSEIPQSSKWVSYCYVWTEVESFHQRFNQLIQTCCGMKHFVETSKTNIGAFNKYCCIFIWLYKVYNLLQMFM